MLAPNRVNEIRKMAEKLHHKSLAEIARDEDIFFVESDLSTISGWISGLIMYRNDKKEFWIFIEEKEHPNRKRFTFAHELGHYFLHKDELQKNDGYFIDTDSTFSLFRSYASEQIEKVDIKKKIMEAEANCFAAELLMPKELVEKAYPELNYNIKELASFFRVSEQAMTFRLFNLSLLNNQ